MLLKCRQLLVMVLLCGSAGPVCLAAGDPPGRLHGTIVGTVSDASGGAQLGATVYLFNRFEKLVRKVLTNEKGAFGFDFLPPDSYSVRVVLPSFLPAVRQNILIQPGIRSFLAINLASLVNSVELVYPGQSPAPLMTDEWKWVLRGTMTTRPVLRYAPPPNRQATTVFGDTRGVVRCRRGMGLPGYLVASRTWERPLPWRPLFCIATNCRLPVILDMRRGGAYRRLLCGRVGVVRRPVRRCREDPLPRCW